MKSLTTRLSLLITLALSVFIGKTDAQDSNIHMPTYNSTRLHFGFVISIYYAHFAITPIDNLSLHFNDSLKGISSPVKSGFNLGIVFELKLLKHLKLRFVPDLAFAERQLTYSFTRGDSSRLISSTFLDFPLDLKLISKRFRNLDAYAIAGAKYTTDLARQKLPSNALPGAVIILNHNDYAYEAGAGIESYLPYFKFVIEAKFSFGQTNLLVKDSSVYTQALQSLKSRMFLLSFTFEG